MIYTEAALKNEHFKNAFDIHNEVFNQLKNLSLDSVDRLSDCVDEYFEAQNDVNSEVEAAGNIMGIFYFFSLVVQTPKFLKNRSSVLLKISENNREIKKALEEPYPDFGDFEKFLNNEETLEFVDNLLLLVKRSIEWSDLADYYIALRYVFSLVDNDLGMEINKRIGVEFLSSFALVKNSYAINFLRLNYSQLE